MKVRAAIAGLLLGAILSACAQQKPALTITVEGQVFHSWDEAETAERKINEERVAATVPTEKPLHGKVLIVLPDADRIMPMVQQRLVGNMAPYIPNVVRTDLNAYNSIAEGVRRSQIFDQVDIETRNDVMDPPFDGHDYVLFLRVSNFGVTWQSQWLLKHAPNANTWAVRVDLGVNSLQRHNAFVKSVHEAADKLDQIEKQKAKASSKSQQL